MLLSKGFCTCLPYKLLSSNLVTTYLTPATCTPSDHTLESVFGFFSSVAMVLASAGDSYVTLVKSLLIHPQNSLFPCRRDFRCAKMVGDRNSTYFEAWSGSPLAVACSTVDSTLGDLQAPNQATIPSDYIPISHIDVRRSRNIPAINIRCADKVSASQGGVISERVSQTLPRHIDGFVCNSRNRNGIQVIFEDGAQ